MWYKFIYEGTFTIRKRRDDVILYKYISNVRVFSRSCKQASAFSYNKVVCSTLIFQTTRTRKSCIHLSTQIHISRTHEDPDVVAHICNLSAFDLKWKVEAGRSLEDHRPASLGVHNS